MRTPRPGFLLGLFVVLLLGAFKNGSGINDSWFPSLNNTGELGTQSTSNGGPRVWGAVNARQVDAGTVNTQALNVAGMPVSGGTLPLTYFNGSSTGATQYAMESGRDTFSTGTKTETLHFSSGTPECACTDQNAVLTGCGVSATPTNTSVAFIGSATDPFSWMCVGLK